MQVKNQLTRNFATFGCSKLTPPLKPVSRKIERQSALKTKPWTPKLKLLGNCRKKNPKKNQKSQKIRPESLSPKKKPQSILSKKRDFGLKSLKNPEKKPKN
jgi:hypothetical protein